MKYVAAVLMLFGSLALPPSAAAAAPAVDDSVTFRGTCSLKGAVGFDPGLGPTILATTSTARASGRCTGVLTLPDGSSRRLTGAPAEYWGRASGQQSCAAGSTRGRSRLDVAGETVRFSFTETRLGVLALIRLRDATGAATTGVASVLPSADSLDQVQACAAPGGLERVPVAIFSGTDGRGSSTPAAP